MGVVGNRKEKTNLQYPKENRKNQKKRFQLRSEVDASGSNYSANKMRNINLEFLTLSRRKLKPMRNFPL